MLIIQPDALRRLPQTLEACDVDAVVLVVDERLWSVHSRTVTGLLGARAAAIAPVCAGQQAMALATVAAVAERSAELAGRRPCVVGFGGGTVLKLAGALAHLLDWGSSLILVPTTLVAMVDVTHWPPRIGPVRSGRYTHPPPSCATRVCWGPCRSRAGGRGWWRFSRPRWRSAATTPRTWW